MLGAESDEELYRYGVEPRAVDRRRGRDCDDQLHERHDGAPEGRAAHAPQPLGQLGTFALHMGVSDRDVYLHTLPMFHCNGWGMTYGVTAMGAQHVVLRKIDGAEILRRVDRHGVTLCAARPRW